MFQPQTDSRSARAAMSQRLFNWDPRSNDQFDLVINTGRVPLDRAVQMILDAYRLKVGTDQ